MTQATPHTVRMYFAEMEGQTNGQRVFDVQLQGQTVLTNFDVYSAAGGKSRCEVVRTFSNVGIASELNIDFVRHAGEPMLSGVEIIDTCTNADGTHIDAPTLPPVAVINASALSGPAPLAVTLDAQGSYDPDGQIMECAWELGDGRLAHGSQIQHIFAEPGAYTVNLLVMDNCGATAATNVTIIVTAGATSAFVCNIRSSGGDYTNLSTWKTAIQSDLTSVTSLLFTVSSAGNYVSATDDGKAVAFTGGGIGTLKHINTTGIAYITGCYGTIQAGAVTVPASGHTFTNADTGHPIYTAVAQCFNDWTNGLNNTVTLAGWVTDPYHCLTIRAAPGQGHTGKIWQGGKYSGFGFYKTINLDASGAPYTRIERILLNTGTLTLGAGASANRMIATNGVTVKGSSVIVANSVAEKFTSNGGVSDVGYYNCTGKSFVKNATAGSPISNQRYVNCLSVSGGLGFTTNTDINCTAVYRASCVSVNGTATNYYLSEQCLSGNLANRSVSLVAPASGDYHLSAYDTGASGKGSPGLGADITGTARTGPAYDAGAYQLANHAPFISGGPWATPNPTATNVAVMFTVLATDMDNDSLTCNWNFGDGGSSSGVNATYAYSGVGVYTASVAVSDGQIITTGSVVITVATGVVTSAVNTFNNWIVQYFGATNAVGAASTNDPTGCGMNNLQKYLLGMNPLDPNSSFKLLQIAPCTGSNGVWWYGGTTNTGFINLFNVEACTNLGGSGWGAKATGLSNSATGTNLWWDTNLPAGVPIFYRINTHVNGP